MKNNFRGEFMEFEKIRKIIAEQMGVSEDKITMETSFMDDLGADSLDLFQIIAEIEECFEAEFSNEAVEKVKTVGDAVELIKNLE